MAQIQTKFPRTLTKSERPNPPGSFHPRIQEAFNQKRGLEILSISPVTWRGM